MPGAVKEPQKQTAGGGPLRLVRYRSLFSGPAIERVEELQFQRPEPVIDVSPQDASIRGIATEDARSRGIESDAAVDVSSNETSVRLRARVSRKLPKGTVRAAEEHVRGLPHDVEVKKA